jgi:hypothetical protein
MSGLAARLPRGRAGEALLIGVAFVVTAAYLVWRAIDVRSYIWIIDEFLYVKGALGFAGGTLSGHVFGAPTSVHAPLYSWLLAPFFGFLNSDHAFKAAHAVDALVFASVLVPVYLTARYLRARPLVAILVALLSTWIPYAAATLVLMSESLAYACFAWAVWAMVRTLAEPTPARDALALFFLAATAYTRPQFVLLFPLFALAVVLVEVGTDSDGTLRDRLRAHWLLGVAAVAGLLLVAVAGSSLLGGYSKTSGLPHFPPGLWQNMLSHAAHIVVGSGLIPAIVWLGWLLHLSGGDVDRRELGFAVLSGLVVLFVFYEVGFYSQNVVGGTIQERTAFYVVPLFALGIAALSADTRPRGPRLSLLAAGAVVALVIGAEAFAPTAASGTFLAIANPGASYNKELQDVVSALSNLSTSEGLARAAIAIGVLAAIAAAPRFRRLGLPVIAGAALLFCVVETTTVLARDVTGLNTTLPSALGSANPPKAWVDGALHATGGDAGALESPLVGADGKTVWLWVEFWNKSLNRVYVEPGTGSYSDLPSLQFEVDKQTGAVTTPLEKEYLVTYASDPRFALQGTTFRQGPYGLNILKPVRPYQAAWAALGPRRVAVYRPTGAPANGPAKVTVQINTADGQPKTVHAVIPAGAARAVVPR